MINTLEAGRPLTYLPNEKGSSGEPVVDCGGPSCAHCGLDATGKPVWYYRSSGLGEKLICKKCADEMEYFEMELGAIMYDDFDKWNLLADRFPKIYKRDFYKQPEVRIALKLKPIKNE